MALGAVRTNGSSAAAPASPVTPDLATSVMAIDLLAHWWSRPVAEEVSAWAKAATRGTEVVAGLPDSDGGPLGVSAEELAGLVDEYERLFVGPGPVPCPPYESFWREDVPIDIRRSLMGPCTADLKGLYGELGIGLSPESRELPDHIAVELEALAYALSSGAGRVANALFLDHLRRWLPRFCRAVAHEAESAFYRDLALRTLRWTTPIQRYCESIDDAGGDAR